jgi:hypothetical protein
MTADSGTCIVRTYESSDETAWLRCRMLGSWTLAW